MTTKSEKEKGLNKQKWPRNKERRTVIRLAAILLLRSLGERMHEVRQGRRCPLSSAFSLLANLQNAPEGKAWKEKHTIRMRRVVRE